MFTVSGLFIQAILLIGGIYWCIAILKRVPSDLRELRGKWQKYKARNSPEVVSSMRSVERQERHQRSCVTDFLTSFVVTLFFWSTTVMVSLLVIGFLTGRIILPIIRAFR